MGGQEAGEVASRLAVETLQGVLRTEWSGRTERDAVPELRNDLRTAVDRANRAVLVHVEKNPQLHGMGATLTTAVVLGSNLVVAHVGDSRCYLLREGFLKSITSDQSLAEELVRRGVVRRDTPAYEARRSVLTRVVGQSGPLVPDSEVVPLARGDRVLLCSDGLYGPVQDDVIRGILSEAADPDAAVERLIEAAKAHGAPDNVTCIVAWLSGAGLPVPDELDQGGGTMSIRMDAKMAAAAADATLVGGLPRKDSTAEFEARQVMEDDTLLGTSALAAAAAAPPAVPPLPVPPGPPVPSAAATAPPPESAAPAPPPPAAVPANPDEDLVSALLDADARGRPPVSGPLLAVCMVVAAIAITLILLYT